MGTPFTRGLFLLTIRMLQKPWEDMKQSNDGRNLLPSEKEYEVYLPCTLHGCGNSINAEEHRLAQGL